MSDLEIQCFDGDGIDPLAIYLQSIGCQEAIDTMHQRGWQPTKREDHPHDFRWDLGDVLDYGAKTRTIVGYAIDRAGKTIYVIKTEKGNINFKTTKEGNKNYGPKIGTDQAVVNGLQP